MIDTDQFFSDICIIGAGSAGLAVAKEFLDSKASVIVIETGGKKPGLHDDDLSSGETVDLPVYNFYDLQKTRARAFGGTSHLWHNPPGLRLRGMDAIDFEKKDWIPFSGWPFGKRELDPYYYRAHQFFKIGSYTYKSEDWVTKEEMNYFESEEEDPFRTTMFHFARKDLFHSDYYNQFKQSENIRMFLHSKVLSIETTENGREVTHLEITVDNEFKFNVKSKYYILAVGGLENPRLLLLSNNQVKPGLGNGKGLVGRFFMEHPHLWGKDNVGTFYPSDIKKFNQTEIFRYQHWDRTPFYRNGTPLLGYLILSEKILRDNKLLNITFGMTNQARESATGYRAGVAALRSALSNIKHGRVGKKMFRELASFSSHVPVVTYESTRRILNGEMENWNRFGIERSGVAINLMAEQAPNPESKVILSNEKDRFGHRKIKLDWQLTDLDMESMNKSIEILNSGLQKRDLGYIDIKFSTDLNEMANRINGGAHHMGTTRMHQDPSQGVVDENCKLHGTENLFVAGSSVFPTSGYANPTLTVAALSIRLADFLKKKMA